MKIFFLLFLFVYSCCGGYYENLEFFEIINSDLPYPIVSSSDVQICDDQGSAAIYMSSSSSYQTLREGAQYSGSMAQNNLAIFDCLTDLFMLSYFAFQDTQLVKLINSSTTSTFSGEPLAGRISSAGRKNYAIGRGAAGVYYFPFDYPGLKPVLTLPTSPVSTIYGVISQRDVVSSAWVTVNDTTAFVEFYGFSANDYNSVPADGRAEYLPKDFSFPVSLAPDGMRFLEYDNIMYYSFQNYLGETFIQAIPSNQSGAYKIGGNNNKLKSYNMVAMGKDNTTLLLAYIYISGNVWIGLWDVTNTVGFASKDLGILVDPTILRNEPIGFYRKNDTYAELYITADTFLRGYGINIIGKTFQPIIVIDVFQVNTSTTVSDLVLYSNSTLVIKDGVVLTVTGCATLNGTLVVQLNNGSVAQVLNNGTINVLVLELVCRDGDFDEIVVQGDYGLTGCDQWKVKPNYSPTQLTLAVSIDKCVDGNTPPPGFDYTGLIIGVVIGGAALVVGILLLSFYFSPLRARVFPYARKD